MDLIRNALEAVRGTIDAHLKDAGDPASLRIVLANLVSRDGATNTAVLDHLVMSVFNIARETHASSYEAPMPNAPRAPSLFIDVDFLVMANFANSNYALGLTALSRAISCLQRTPVIDRTISPGLDPAIDKVMIEMMNLGPIDVNTVMAMHGANYLPTVFYRLRMLPFASA